MEKCYSKYGRLLERYRSNSLSKDELVELFDWINSTEGKVAYGQQLSVQLNRLNDYKNRLYIFSLYDLKKYAAILVIALLTGGIAWWMTRNTYVDNGTVVFEVAKGNKGMLTLLDGSELWLNAESKVSYTVGSDQRKISLEGEAFLQVAKDKKQRFVVSTPFADIFVYGTSFNVTAYPTDSVFNVSLVEGSVGIKIAGQDDLAYITPGQTASFDMRNGKMEVYNKDLTDLALWRNDELIMVNTDVNTLYGKMEAWYGVRITLANQSAKNHLYNMTIRNENIEEMLELINSITPIMYIIKEKEVTVKYK